MKIFYWMISVVKLKHRLIKNSEHGSLFLYLLSFAVFCLSACQPSSALREVVFSGPIMGTTYRVVVIADLTESEQATLETTLVASMEKVNRSMSTYLPDSELSRLNRTPKNTPFKVSGGFREVLRESQQISAMSQGAFDVTLGKAIRLWGFGRDGRIEQKPDEATLRAIRNQVGYHRVNLNGDEVTKLTDGMELNFSAIAKGYAVDEVANALAIEGYRNYLVDIGGELRASGQALDGEAWRVAIERPHPLGGVQQVVHLMDKAIATSGDYRNYLIVDGEQFSHTIDPKTLKPVYHKLASVSVIAPRCSTADALATALLSMGEERGVAFARKHNLNAYFLIRTSQPLEFEAVATGQFKVNLQ